MSKQKKQKEIGKCRRVGRNKGKEEEREWKRRGVNNLENNKEQRLCSMAMVI